MKTAWIFCRWPMKKSEIIQQDQWRCCDYHTKQSLYRVKYVSHYVRSSHNDVVQNPPQKSFRNTSSPFRLWHNRFETSETRWWIMTYHYVLWPLTKLWFKSSFDACTESIVPKSCLLLRPQDGVNLLFVRLQKENLATKFISLGSISITSSIHTTSSNIL